MIRRVFLGTAETQFENSESEFTSPSLIRARSNCIFPWKRKGVARLVPKRSYISSFLCTYSQGIDETRFATSRRTIQKKSSAVRKSFAFIPVPSLHKQLHITQYVLLDTRGQVDWVVSTRFDTILVIPAFIAIPLQHLDLKWHSMSPLCFSCALVPAILTLVSSVLW